MIILLDISAYYSEIYSDFQLAAVLLQNARSYKEEEYGSGYERRMPNFECEKKKPILNKFKKMVYFKYIKLFFQTEAILLSSYYEYLKITNYVSIIRISFSRCK